ncbi:MAG: rod shape-determining protein MreC [Flavobacteriaceae bacterium]|nr:rod shape-determining protein MreC [Flavobacteriaceae bacterium]
MQQLIYFIQKYKYFLFFLLLEFVALFITINNTNFHKSKFISSANEITGGLYEKATQLSDYFSVKAQNEALIFENTSLKNQLEFLNSKTDTVLNHLVVDSLKFNQKYVYTSAKIIKNNYHKKNNYITINVGSEQGVLKEMAVINNKGIIGITDQTSYNYARVQSILNSNSKINARLKNSTHFGTLTWDGKEYNTVQLTDIPRQAILKIGDTIITGGKSTIFPEGILIGLVKKINDTNSISTIDIELFNDMSNLSNVYIVKSLDKTEIESLEKTENE